MKGLLKVSVPEALAPEGHFANDALDLQSPVSRLRRILQHSTLDGPRYTLSRGFGV